MKLTSILNFISNSILFISSRPARKSCVRDFFKDNWKEIIKKRDILRNILWKRKYIDE